MIYQVLKLVGSALVDFGGAVGGVFVKVWGYLDAFYGRVLKPFVSWAWTQVQRVHNWAVKTFGPLIKHLELLREWILRTYDKWLKPIFETITALRGILRVLEVFHVPFADAIDRKLADLEARLLVPIRFALTKINELINWVDRIVTFDGLFQRLTLVASLLRYDRDLWKAWWSGLHKTERDKPTTPGNWPEGTTPKDYASSVAAYMTTGGGPDSAVLHEYAQDVALMLTRNVPLSL